MTTAMATIDETTGEVIEGFASTQSRALAEVNTKALEATARAAVESRYVMALKRPRNPDMARTVLLRDCKRPGFAESAVYAKPIGGGKVTGLSVRFAEAALRAWGNVLCESQTVYDDDEKRIVRITVTDLEANVTFPKEVTIAKRVERSKASSATSALSAPPCATATPAPSEPGHQFPFKVAATRVSKLRRPISGLAYFEPITSPCSVRRICPRTVPGGCAKIAW